MCLIRVEAKLCRDTGPPGPNLVTPVLSDEARSASDGVEYIEEVGIAALWTQVRKEAGEQVYSRYHVFSRSKNKGFCGISVFSGTSGGVCSCFNFSFVTRVLYCTTCITFIFILLYLE